MRRLMLCLALAAAPAAAEPETYMGVVLGSRHFGGTGFNDVNPGLTWGRRWPVGAGRWERHVEAGVFYNSYREVSPIAVAGLSTRVARVGPGEVRVGLSVGTAYYEDLSRQLERDYGVPNVAGFIPIGLATVTYRLDRAEWRLSLLPVQDDVDAVVNLSVAVPF